MSELGQPQQYGCAIEALTQQEFAGFRQFIYLHAGVSLSQSKCKLVASRLFDRVRSQGFNNYRDYLAYLNAGHDNDEVQIAIDRLTTHETYFFREPKHFKCLREHVFPEKAANDELAIWSAACSSGEEAYSIAMECAENYQGNQWRILASDISQQVISAAKVGRYPIQATERIPQAYLAKYCRKGVRQYQGHFCVASELQRQIEFAVLNLNQQFNHDTEFDVIFLRKVLIYFSQEKRAELTERVIDALKPGGYLFVGHTEMLGSSVSALTRIQTAVYQK